RRPRKHAQRRKFSREQYLRIKSSAGTVKESTPWAGVPLLAGNVCHLSAEHSVCVVLERTRPLVFRPGSWVVVRVDRLLAGKAAGWVRRHAGASAPPPRARSPAPAPLPSDNARPASGPGRRAASTT